MRFLNVGPEDFLTRFSDRQRLQLAEQGFVLLEDVLGSEETAACIQLVERLYALEGDQAGGEFRQEPGVRRLANLIDKGDLFLELAQHPWICAAVAAVLGDHYKLSSFNARSAESGRGHQPMHVDMGALPDELGYWVCNAIWMLDDFTESNGATSVIPGSHRWAALPGESVDVTQYETVQLVGSAGSVAVINAHLWHAGTTNETDAPRRALHAFYCRRDKPQQQYQKQLVRDTIQQTLEVRARWLLALDDPQNDRLSAGEFTRSGFLK